MLISIHPGADFLVRLNASNKTQIDDLLIQSPAKEPRNRLSSHYGNRANAIVFNVVTFRRVGA